MSTPPKPPPPTERAGPTILVAEDDDDVRETIVEILSDEGYRPLAAAGGAEAIALLEDGAAPDALLLDLMMPGVGGAEVCAALAAMPALAGLPLAVMSADGRLAEKAAALGVTRWLRKPIELADLLALAERLTAGARGQMPGAAETPA